jgi:hypothetical protein
MAVLSSILLGLVTTLLGFVIGRLWKTFQVRRRCWMAREFWNPVVDGQFQIVISRFPVDGFREPTKVVGGGDAIAHRLLGDMFMDIGLDRPPTVYVDEPGLDRKKNLVALGGPLENRVAREICSRVNPGLRIVDPGPGLPMQVEVSPQPGGPNAVPKVYVAEPADDNMTDYGVVIRAANPFVKGRASVVIQGTYGFGTWAGVELTQKEEFLTACADLDAEHDPPTGRARSFAVRTRRRLGLGDKKHRDWAEIECLFEVDVLDRHPVSTEILCLRRIASS